jgi:hypothetical protein
MSIEYQIRDEGVILRVKAVGTCDNLEQLKEYVLAIHQAALSAGLTRALVDERELRYCLSTIDSFDSGSFVAEMAPFGSKIAVLCGLEGKADTEFWATVAVNRGAEVEVFDDVEGAEEWLRCGCSLVSQNQRTIRPI